jgi:hypothetical protein
MLSKAKARELFERASRMFHTEEDVPEQRMGAVGGPANTAPLSESFLDRHLEPIVEKNYPDPSVAAHMLDRLHTESVRQAMTIDALCDKVWRDHERFSKLRDQLEGIDLSDEKLAVQALLEISGLLCGWKEEDAKARTKVIGDGWSL